MNLMLRYKKFVRYLSYLNICANRDFQITKIYLGSNIFNNVFINKVMRIKFNSKDRAHLKVVY